MKQLLKDKAIEKLTERGYQVTETKSNKYIKMAKPGSDIFYFIGRKGSVRKGKNIANSVSRTAMFK